jgi:hypothetical protein
VEGPRCVCKCAKAFELEGVRTSLLQPPEAFAARVAGYVTDLVEPAKVVALEDLDEGHQALGIPTSWLRGKLGQ